jgi:putative aminopeptidase FrvX
MNITIRPKTIYRRFIFLTLFSLTCLLSAQNSKNPVINPHAKDFSKTLICLSSDSMEGREAGTNGAALASDYIALMMLANGLQPYGDISSGNTRSWFQNFEAVSYNADRDSVSLMIKKDGKTLVFNMNEAKEVKLRNVLGIIPGKDTSRSIIIGAHYDHLGIRDGKIHNGADDNASGVSGLLALAGVWSVNSEKPPCNIIFASWTAEEKGEIGSLYFLQNLKTKTDRIILSINMDMISRSAPEDSSGRQISIGTLPSGENLRIIARVANMKLTKPFQLDLWDVSGHYGSDYAYFAERQIPVMTFFSGFNEDYHTSKDKIEKVDLQKMSDILELVNDCILQVTEKIRTNKLNTE